MQARFYWTCEEKAEIFVSSAIFLVGKRYADSNLNINKKKMPIK